MSAPPAAVAISRWNQSIASEADLDGRIEAWRRHFSERELELDGRPLCSVLRPHLLDEERLARQAEVARLLVGALARVRAALDVDEALYRLHLGNLHDWIGHLIALEPRPAGEAPLLRLDASLARTRLHFIEANADTPAGAGHNDAILDFFESTPAYARLAEDFELRPLRLRPGQLEALLGAWREWGGTGSPAICILTRLEDAIRRTSVMQERDFYASRGVDATIAEPGELSFAGGRLRAGDKEVDLVHRVMVTGEFLGGVEGVGPLLDAVRVGAVCLVNPFRSELLGHKAIFALLTDPAHDFGFSAAERRAIREHVPWARPVREGATTDPDGESVDLVEYLRAHRRELVLKPAHGYGGHGVELGWRHDDSGWERAIGVALEADFVAQHRVELQREEYPTLEPGAPGRLFYEDTDPFMFRGEFGGLLTRLAGSEVTNLHADGSVCASVAVSPRG